jgi:hypothetical protein
MKQETKAMTKSSFSIFLASIAAPLTNLLTFLRFCSVPLFYQLAFGVLALALNLIFPTPILILVTLIGQIILFLFFDTLFDVSVSRLTDHQSLGTGFSRLTFANCGWRTFWVNVKLMGVFFPLFILVALFGLFAAGLFYQPSATAVMQYIKDASVMPESIYALVKHNLLNVGLLVAALLVGVLYLYTRFCSAEPAAALGEDPSLCQAWRSTRSNKTLLFKIHWLLLPLFLAVSWSDSYFSDQNVLVAHAPAEQTAKYMTHRYTLAGAYMDIYRVDQAVVGQKLFSAEGLTKNLLPSLLFQGLSLLIGYLFSFIAGVAVTLSYRQLAPRNPSS